MFAVSSTLRSLAGRYVASVAEKNGMEMEGKEELMIDGRAAKRGREIPIFTADKGYNTKTSIGEKKKFAFLFFSRNIFIRGTNLVVLRFLKVIGCFGIFLRKREVAN